MIRRLALTLALMTALAAPAVAFMLGKPSGGVASSCNAVFTGATKVTGAVSCQ